MTDQLVFLRKTYSADDIYRAHEICVNLDSAESCKIDPNREERRSCFGKGGGTAETREAQIRALLTSSARVSAEREVPDAATFDESIAEGAIDEEKDAVDGRFAACRKLAQDVSKPQIRNAKQVSRKPKYTYSPVMLPSSIINPPLPVGLPSSANGDHVAPSPPLNNNEPNRTKLSERSSFLDRHKTKILVTVALVALTGIAIYAYFYLQSMNGLVNREDFPVKGQQKSKDKISASATSSDFIEQTTSNESIERNKPATEGNDIKLTKSEEMLAGNKNWFEKTPEDLDKRFEKKREELHKQIQNEKEELRKQAENEKEEWNKQIQNENEELRKQAENEKEEWSKQFKHEVEESNKRFEKTSEELRKEVENENEEWNKQFKHKVEESNKRFEKMNEELRKEAENEREERHKQTEKENKERDERIEKENEEMNRRFKKMNEETEARYQQRRAEERKSIEDLEAAMKKRKGQTWREEMDFLQANVLEYGRRKCGIQLKDYQNLSDMEFVMHPDLDPTCWFHAKAILGRGEKEGEFNKDKFIDEGCSYAEHLYRGAALSLHPDKGGSAEAMDRLMAAKEEICAFATQPPLPGEQAIKQEESYQDLFLRT